MGMVSEGLPITRQERGAHQDILAGADFLSVLLETSRDNEKETTTTIRYTSPKHFYKKTMKPRELRHPRSTSVDFLSSTEFAESAQIQIGEETKVKHSSDELNNKFSAINNTNTSLVVSVQVSSSEGNTRINKIISESKGLETVTKMLNDSQNNIITSDEYLSIPAEINKSDFSIDEAVPITIDSISAHDGLTQEYPARVESVPNSIKDKIDPYGHHSLMYHEQPARGRSVSYSTVIQALPKTHLQNNAKDLNYKERQERHFDIENTPNDNQPGVAKNSPSSVAETNDYFVTAKYELPEDYRKQLVNEQTPLSSTEKYWDSSVRTKEQLSDMKRQRIPMIYGKPEQNYEIDESVSVVSNGRVHGVQNNKIQLTHPPANGKNDLNNDNQKVGYVVEGRNYRKYRVEERTADGFIVGDNSIPAFRFYRSAQPRFPLEALSEAASALNADNSDIEDDVAETTSADIGDCDLWVPEDEEEDEENEEKDEENIENKISDSEIEASGNSRRTNKAISNLKCKKYVM
ncbi:hypothetical protein FQA39_LY01559 [Lamprigera yunnana]|nr:hypothetical protein FQA39_LY01559 [Lamprigera yunnana]